MEKDDKEFKRQQTVFEMLWKIIVSREPDAGKFHNKLEAALAGGFNIDFPGFSEKPLLYYAAASFGSVQAGLPQILIAAGADENAKDNWDRTPLGSACMRYVSIGAPEYLAIIDVLLAGRQNAAGTRNALRNSPNAPAGRGRSVAGARPELSKGWKEGWAQLPQPEMQARAARLMAFIKTWRERRARNRVGDAAPGFNYAL